MEVTPLQEALQARFTAQETEHEARKAARVSESDGKPRPRSLDEALKPVLARAQAGK
ncbi:hypothetical protein [Isoptericola sp. AK164]|uniref:hypothetical protein n=1 Tax=Isoptericola sp. AK164 TaxID=3024246 RepID=UPI00241866F6|nr:hypothetical protein [Isoptericola sp. AK164]